MRERLEGKTSAEARGIEIAGKDEWETLIQTLQRVNIYATYL